MSEKIIAHRMALRVFLLAAACLQIITSAAGQNLGNMRVTIPKLEKRAIIDGRLDDDAWGEACEIPELRQSEPATGLPGSERTRILLYCTHDTLYIGVEAFDKTPSGIIGRHLKRDSAMEGDDYISIAIDPHGDRRTGYLFSVNPRGACADGMIVSGENVNNDWNGIWYAKARLTDAGWIAEIAVPFASLSFKDDGAAWGLNIGRYISRKNEYQRWSSPTRNTYVQHMGNAGQALGLAKLKRGRGIDFIPYAKAQWIHMKDSGKKPDEYTADAGFDLFYRFLTTASVAFTANTDFSSTEIDGRVINLTRFPVRLPEKREFFLRDCEVFDFGGISTAPLPFFSRRVGLDERGRAVDILAGIKSAGKIGRISYGLIDVETKRDDGAKRNLGVVRAQTDLLDESSAGIIFTRGDPDGAKDAWLGGADINYRSSKWRGDGYTSLSGFAMLAGTPGDAASDPRASYGLNYQAKSDRIALEGALLRVDENFDAPLGFVRQSGIYNIYGEIRIRWRPSFANDIDWVVSADHTMDLDGNPDYFSACPVNVSITNLSLDNFGLKWKIFSECVQEEFTVGKGISIPEGTYDTMRGVVWYNTKPSRPVRLTAQMTFGGFYDGNSIDGTFSLDNRILSRLHTMLSYTETIVRTPRENFSVRSGSIRADVLFTPDLALMLIGQWDNISESFGLNLRLRWTVTPGRDLYIVLNQHARTDAGWRPEGTDVTAKVNWTFRF